MAARHEGGYYANDDGRGGQGTPHFRRDRPGRWFLNQRFRYRNVGGATAERLGKGGVHRAPEAPNLLRMLYRIPRYLLRQKLINLRKPESAITR